MLLLRSLIVFVVVLDSSGFYTIKDALTLLPCLLTIYYLFIVLREIVYVIYTVTSQSIHNPYVNLFRCNGFTSSAGVTSLRKEISFGGYSVISVSFAFLVLALSIIVRCQRQKR